MNTLSFVGGAGFALFGICMLRHAVRNHKKALASTHWPTVRGKLVDVHLWGGRNIGGQMTAANKLSVKYEYIVGGKVHAGTSVTFYTLHYPETINFAQRHPPNSEITVHYNPLDAAESVLLSGPRKDKPHSDLVIGVLGIVVGAAISVLSWMGLIG